MNNTVIDVINALCEKLGIAIDWTSENVVPYLNDLVGRFAKWVILEKSIRLAVLAAILIVLWTIAGKMIAARRKKIKENNEDWRAGGIWIDGYDDPTVAFWITFICTVITIVFCFTIVGLSRDITKAITLPEMAFAEYIAQACK